MSEPGGYLLFEERHGPHGFLSSIVLCTLRPVCQAERRDSNYPIRLPHLHSPGIMAFTANLKFLLAIFFTAGVAAADGGDDFSNNLFSDLAPYVLSSILSPLMC